MHPYSPEITHMLTVQRLDRLRAEADLDRLVHRSAGGPGDPQRPEDHGGLQRQPAVGDRTQRQPLVAPVSRHLGRL
jgi:hypothetical protein